MKYEVSEVPLLTLSSPSWSPEVLKFGVLKLLRSSAVFRDVSPIKFEAFCLSVDVSLWTCLCGRVRPFFEVSPLLRDDLSSSSPPVLVQLFHLVRFVRSLFPTQRFFGLSLLDFRDPHFRLIVLFLLDLLKTASEEEVEEERERGRRC